MSYDYDLFVIGAGSGGVRAARISAQHGARVAIAEERYLGGTCVNVGCVPKKLLVYGAAFSQSFEDARGFGWSVGDRSHDWATLIANKDREIARLNHIYRRLLEGPGVKVYDARAVLIDAHTVEVGGERVTAGKILIATGGWPVAPDAPGAREFGISSNEVFALPERPERVVVVGGGYIALEFASVFQGLGSQVSLLYRGARFLRGFDDDVREVLSEQLSKSGMDLRFHTVIDRVERVQDGLLVSLSDGSTLDADCVVFAIGRTPKTIGLGLEQVGVELDERGAIKVDGNFRTNVESIYAVGDVCNRLNLTPVALAEGHALADALFGPGGRTVNYQNVPTAVFSLPPVASVGLTEREARERHGAVDIYRSSFKPMLHTLSGRDAQTMMKLVVERSTQRVLGAHMIGPDGPEIIQGIAIALNCGATKQDFDRTIGLHPTAAEEFVTMRTRLPDPPPPGVTD